MQVIQNILKRTGASTPALDAQVLLAHVLGCTREHLIAHDDEPVAHSREWFYHLLAFRRRRGVPVAYLTGHKEFFGLDFAVNRHMLIPRPETELLVELAVNRLLTIDHSPSTILIDIGTGSGCIPIAILKDTNAPIKTFAIDSSKKALEVAKRNAARHGVDITFLRGNLLEPFLMKQRALNKEQIILTANLPYLTPTQYAEEPSIRYEPRSALVGGKIGLELYEKLIKQLQPLNAKRYTLNALFEIDPSQSAAMKALIKKYLPDALVEIHKDLAGRDRVVTVAQPQSKSVRP